MMKDKGAGRIVKAWRAWLRLHEGGLMGLAIPAKDRKDAERLAEEAERCFEGTLIELDYMGEVRAENG